MSLFKKNAEPVAEGTIDESQIDSVESVSRTSEYKKYSPASPVKQVIEVMLLEFKQYFKSKGLIFLFVLGALIPLLQVLNILDIVGFVGIMFKTMSGNVYDLALSSSSYLHYCLIFLPIIMLLAMVFLCGRTISQEYTGRTCFLNFPLPMEKWVIYTGKFLAIFITSMTLILFTYGLGMVATTAKYGSVVLDPVYQSILLSLIVMLALIATGMFFSSVCKRRGGMLSFLLLFFVFPVILFVIAVGNNSFSNLPEFFLYTPTFALDSILVLISWDPTVSLSGALIGNGYLHIADFGPTAIAMILWAIVFFAAGVYLFNRREA